MDDASNVAFAATLPVAEAGKEPRAVSPAGGKTSCASDGVDAIAGLAASF
jgi:hypothetical protein